MVLWQERMRLKRLLVLNFAVWRFIGGTVLFASHLVMISMMDHCGYSFNVRLSELEDRGVCR